MNVQKYSEPVISRKNKLFGGDLRKKKAQFFIP